MRRALGLVVLLGGLLGVIAAPAWAQVTGLEVVPSVAFPSGPAKAYSFTIRGSGLPLLTAGPSDLQFRGRETLVVCVVVDDKNIGKCDLTNPSVSTMSGEWRFTEIPERFAGRHKFTVSQGGRTYVKGEIIFSVSERITPYIISIAIIIMLLLIVALIVGNGREQMLKNGSMATFAKRMLIDSKTATFSLSKLQFYVWAVAVLAGYIYLCTARSLVQGDFTFAQVPDNLIYLLLISFGTSAFATGISTAGIDKGAGEVEPQLSDLVTSGGVVAPERLQQLVWTILGGISFVFFAFSISPATIEKLPDIPSGFLQLMGVSAAGYLSGKIARGAGPVINTLSATIDTAATPNRLKLVIDGTGLNMKAGIYRFAKLGPNAASPNQDDPTITNDVQLASTPVPTSSVADTSGVATHIEVVVELAKLTPHTPAKNDRLRVTFVNPDGEKAVKIVVVE